MQPRTISRIILALVAADLAICLAYLIDAGTGGASVKLSLLLDLEGEGNLPTWFSSMQLFLVAGTTALFAAGVSERARRSTWLAWALPAAFLALSLDEVAEIHEYLGYRSDALLPGRDRANTVFSYTGIWMFVIALPFLAIMAALLWRLRRHFRAAGVLRKYLAGLALLVVGAAGGDLVANFVTVGSWAHVIEVFFEELGEMLGATIMVWAGLEQLRAGAIAPRWSVARPLRPGPLTAVRTDRLAR